MALMQKASAGAPKGQPFTPADPSKIVAPQMKDVVDRVVAAGMKLMYAPQMAQQRMEAVKSTDPIPKKLAENVVGLTLTLDQQTKGGIPVEAIFPAAMMLLTEAAQMLTQAGQEVTDEDYKDAARIMFVLIGKKLGGTDDQIMGAAEQALPGGGDGADAQDATDGAPDAQAGDGDGPDNEDATDAATDPQAGATGQPPAQPGQPMPDDHNPDEQQVR